MKNVNFDSLTNIKAPESWIDNALNIPKTVDKKKPVFFIKHARTLAAVACLVFVSVISLVLFLSNDKVTPQIDQNVKETKATTYSAQTNNSTQHNDEPSKEQNSKQENKPQRPTTPYEAIEPTEGDSPQKPTTGGGNTQDPTRPIGPPKPTESVRPTQGGSGGRPTEGEGDPPLPTEPCLPPDEIEPSEPMWEAPTEPEDYPPEAPGSPGNPDNPPAVTPTEKPAEGTISNVTFTATVKLSSISAGQTVYCKVYDSNNRLIGDPNEYSLQHQAGFLNFTDTTATLVYYMPNGLITKHGTYSYYFYTDDGETLYYNTKYI